METNFPPCVRQLRAAIALLPDAPVPDLLTGMISYTKAAIALEAALEIVDRESRNMDTAKAAVIAAVRMDWHPSEIPASLRLTP